MKVLTCVARPCPSGEAIVRRLAKEGYAVTVNDIAANKAGVDKLVAELNEAHGPGTSTGVIADVTSSAQVKAMIDESCDRLGPLTVMVANAGIAPVGSALEVSDDFAANIMNVNFMGVWHCYTHAARRMIAQGPVPEGSTGYKLLGAASIAAYRPAALLAPYCASKAAVKSLSQVFAVELAKHKISVNCYSPGVVGTEMWREIDEGTARIEGAKLGETTEKMGTKATAMARVSVPDDVAKVVGGFLCGPDADFVTGQNIVVDGGIVFP
ncbi:hypothetical protein VUR80DRAFT_2781 [Thermomyces stellatus]